MITRHERGKTVWVDLESPTREELSEVIREFGIDGRIEEEILSPTPYPLSIAFPGYAYLILHFPTSCAEEGARAQEMDFIVGKHFLITARYEHIDCIHNLHKVFEAEELLETGARHVPIASLLERVMDRMYAAISGEIERQGDRLERIERDIFSGKERQTVRRISETGRVLLRFETALARHKEPLEGFLATLAAPTFLGVSFDEHAAHIEAKRVHVAALVASYRAVAQELRTTNDSLLSSSQNQVMKNLTVMSFLALPLTLLASIFGMNAVNMPIVESEHGFLAILGLMAATSLILFTFFRLKKWL